MPENKEKATTIAALASAIVASLCCLGPVLAIALGLGGAATFSAFDRFRPLALGLTVVLLGIAFYRVYRQRDVPCEDGTCRVTRGSSTAKATLWTVTVLALGFMTSPYWLSTVTNKKSLPDAKTNASQKIMVSIQGMTCPSCTVHIQKALTAVPGVNAAQIDFKASQAEVFVQRGQVNPQRLIQAVESSGYKAALKEAPKKHE